MQCQVLGRFSKILVSLWTLSPISASPKTRTVVKCSAISRVAVVFCMKKRIARLSGWTAWQKNDPAPVKAIYVSTSPKCTREKRSATSDRANRRCGIRTRQAKRMRKRESLLYSPPSLLPWPPPPRFQSAASEEGAEHPEARERPGKILTQSNEIRSLVRLVSTNLTYLPY